MSGDISECYGRAARCAELARQTDSQEAKQVFVELALTWLRLGSHLERCGALVGSLAVGAEAPELSSGQHDAG